jgi:hypothetical protein
MFQSEGSIALYSMTADSKDYCSRGEEKCIQNFGEKARRDHYEGLSVGERLIFR